MNKLIDPDLELVDGPSEDEPFYTNCAEMLINLSGRVFRADVAAMYEGTYYRFDLAKKMKDDLDAAMPRDVAEAVIDADSESVLSHIFRQQLSDLLWNPILSSAERVTGTAARMLVYRILFDWKRDPGSETAPSGVLAAEPGKYARYASEMLAFEMNEDARQQAIQDEKYVLEAARLSNRAEELECSVALLQYIESLERRTAA